MNRYKAVAVVYEDGHIRQWHTKVSDKDYAMDYEAKSVHNLWEQMYRVVAKWVRADMGGKTMDIYRRVQFARVKDLWADLQKVCGVGMITEDWGEFPTGTNIKDIWAWFEQTFEISVYADLLEQEDVLDYGDIHFKVVDKVPIGDGYHVWNIGRSMAEGYIPFCQMKGEQRFDGGRDIVEETLLAVRCEDSYAIMDAIGAGPETPGEMEQFILENQHMTGDVWQKEAIRRMKIAIPLMRKLNWGEKQ